MLVGRQTMLLAMAIFGCLAAGAASVEACDVPVFRYALERWSPDLYRAVIFHRGPLGPAQTAAVDILRQASTEKDGPAANLTIHTIDVTGRMSPSAQALWQQHRSADLPLVVLAYPPRMAGGRTIWSGPLSSASARAVLESPLRAQLARGLVDGQSAVWLLVESGDRERDDAAARLLADTLATMPEKLELPPRMIELAQQTGGSPLRIEFSLLRLSRTDPAEAVFAGMLLGSEADLGTEYASEPAAFAAFGRGRLAFALVGKGINAANILATCRFLTGPCACVIKDENPGVDLLLSADWEAAIGTSLVDDIELPQPVGPAALQPPAPGEGTGPVGGAPTVFGLSVRNMLIAVGFMILAAVVLVLVTRKALSRSSS